jgi:hypothetical protein
MTRPGLISIWFFIGVIVLIYGVLILGAGIYYDLIEHSPANVVMADLHAGIWWGALLTVIGVFYTLKFKPGSTK